MYIKLPYCVPLYIHLTNAAAEFEHAMLFYPSVIKQMKISRKQVHRHLSAYDICACISVPTFGKLYTIFSNEYKFCEEIGYIYRPLVERMFYTYKVDLPCHGFLYQLAESYPSVFFSTFVNAFDRIYKERYEDRYKYKWIYEYGKKAISSDMWKRYRCIDTTKNRLVDYIMNAPQNINCTKCPSIKEINHADCSSI